MRDTEGFDAFYAATARRVLAHVYAVCGDRAEAQDITQEAYARAWQRWSQVQACDSPEAWVRTVAWRLAVNRWRAMRRWLATRARLAPAHPDVGPSPDGVALIAALRRIPEAQRRVVVLHYLCGMSVAEVAAETEAPVGTVKARLSRGRSALAGLLADTSEEAEGVR